MAQKLLVITLGDPYSINIEAIAKLWHELPTAPVAITGSYWQFRDQLRRLGEPLPTVKLIKDFDQTPDVGVAFYDTGVKASEALASELSPVEQGREAVAALRALGGLKNVERLAVLTCPLAKNTAHAAGFEFPGQTEFIEGLWQGRGVMVLAGPKLRVGLATNHVAVSKLSSVLHADTIVAKLSAFHQTLRQVFRITTPKIAVCGFNPHCSDGGLFGDEETRIIKPALERFNRAEKNCATGPLPADTVFFRALQGEFDGVLAMYHDQGLGPLKTAHFYDAINITGGLRHLRVSPDHGPAADLFLKGKANLESFRQAFLCARHYLEQ